jgi:hypothetical protein
MRGQVAEIPRKLAATFMTIVPRMRLRHGGEDGKNGGSGEAAGEAVHVRK